MTKMPLAEHNNVVKAFSSDRTAPGANSPLDKTWGQRQSQQSDHFRENSENCARLADSAKNEPQQWLDGETSPQQKAP
jgi:hypothetical protein